MILAHSVRACGGLPGQGGPQEGLSKIELTRNTPRLLQKVPKGVHAPERRTEVHKVLLVSIEYACKISCQ